MFLDALLDRDNVAVLDQARNRVRRNRYAGPMRHVVQNDRAFGGEGRLFEMPLHTSLIRTYVRRWRNQITRAVPAFITLNLVQDVARIRAADADQHRQAGADDVGQRLQHGEAFGFL